MYGKLLLGGGHESGFGYKSITPIGENDSLFHISPHRRLLGRQFHLLGNSRSIPLRIWLGGEHYHIRFASSFEELGTSGCGVIMM